MKTIDRVALMGAVLASLTLSASERLVLLALVWSASDDGAWDVDLVQLSERTMLPLVCVLHALLALDWDGAIEVTGEGENRLVGILREPGGEPEPEPPLAAACWPPPRRAVRGLAVA